MKKILLFVLFLALSFSACTELDLKNTNNPDRTSVLNTSEGVQTIIEGSYLSTFKEILGYRSPYPEFFADQATSCSLSMPWPCNREPRENIPNTVGNSVASNLYGGSSYSNWAKFYNHIANANNALFVMKKGVKMEDKNGKDISEVFRAHCLFIRGINLGYLSMIHRRVVIMTPDTNLQKVKLVPYADGVKSAVKDLEDAKALFKKQGASYKNDYFEGGSFALVDLEKIINTFAAKFMIGQARTKAEAKTLDFAKIKSYLETGYDKDFILDGNRSKSYYNRLQYYGGHIYRGGKTYYGCDQKLIHLMSQVDGGLDDVKDGTGKIIKTGKSTPKKRPKSLGTKDMVPIVSKDARLDLYYEHKQGSLFYYYERDPRLYSNYRYKRYYWKDYGDFDLLLFRTEEVRLLKAEVAYWQGDYAAAKALIDGGERVKTGKLQPVAATEKAISDALFYETCIELNGGGFAIAWSFMRRHDRLQKGTMIHYPVFALEIQNLGAGKAINIGGVDKADGKDTALETPTSWIKQSELK